MTMTRTNEIAVCRWIEKDSSRLRNELIAKYGMIDEDAWQDAFIILSENSPHPPESIEEVFLSAYRRIQSRNFSETFKTVHPEDSYFIRLKDKKDSVDEQLS